MQRISTVSLLLVLTAATVGAMYAPHDLEQIPVDRLVANLEIIAKERPKDFWVQVNIGRAHGMAYAQKVETVLAMRVKGARPEDMSPFVQLDAPYVPFRRVELTNDSTKQAAAAAHLAAAIVHFRKALEIDSRQPIARLSLGWCLEQSGDKAEAITTYRELIQPWLDRQPAGRTLEEYVVAEAIGYLVPLLDPTKDAAEIVSLRQRRERILSIPRPVTPVAIPLHDGLRLTDVIDDDAVIRFDADGTGLRNSWTWITPRAAWLVYDQRGYGDIGSALQLFGSVSFWMFWETGYDAMSALDDNRDGHLAGSELTSLGLWHDGNGNGMSDRGEVQSLTSWHVVALSYDYVRMTDADRTAWVPRGVTFRDGTIRPTWDVVLQPAK